jgi:hypothetical protein
MDDRFLKMEQDIGELKTDVAVMASKFDNLNDNLEKYMIRQQDEDGIQNEHLKYLDENKADKTDIKSLAETIKWAVGLTITVILPSVAAIIKFLF